MLVCFCSIDLYVYLLVYVLQLLILQFLSLYIDCTSQQEVQVGAVSEVHTLGTSAWSEALLCRSWEATTAITTESTVAQLSAVTKKSTIADL